MKLLSAISVAVSATAVLAGEFKHANVFPSVLYEDSIIDLHEQVGTLRFLRHRKNDGKNRQYGEADVQKEDLERILLAMGDTRVVHEPTVKIRSTLITGDTESHVDAKVSADKFEEAEDVMFMFLETNKGAYFQIEGEKVPAVAGTLVLFKGNRKLHNTVVPSGTEVRLLGPVATRDLDGVTAEYNHCGDGAPDACGGDDNGHCLVDCHPDGETSLAGCLYQKVAGGKRHCVCISCESTCDLLESEASFIEVSRLGAGADECDTGGLGGAM